MSVKQDRTYARTTTDLERKYQFGKTFAEHLGLINEARDKVDSVESTLRNEIIEQETSIKRDTEQIVLEAKSELTTEVGEVEETLTKKVEAKLDAEDFDIQVEQVLKTGVDEVVTKSGYSFGADGLNISREGEEMNNTLDHTGMYVKRGDETILQANNNGVDAVNLHAKTYLIVGSGAGRSRFEDYGTNRTGVFWIGG